MSFRHSPSRSYNISSDSAIEPLSMRQRGGRIPVATRGARADAWCLRATLTSRVLSFPYRYLSYIFSPRHSPTSTHPPTHVHLSFNQREATSLSISSPSCSFYDVLCIIIFALPHFPHRQFPACLHIRGVYWYSTLLSYHTPPLGCRDEKEGERKEK